jgi:hypothetical protein
VKRKKADRGKDNQRNALPRNVEESNSIGIEAGDATSGIARSPREWAEEQGIEDSPTFPLEPGDPSPMQPAAGSPHSGKDKSPEAVGKERERPKRRAA